LISIITGTIGFIVWQLIGNGATILLMMPVVFGCLVSVITFFVVNWIEWARGVEPAPSAYLTAEEEAAVLAKESEEM
jgi:SSS family solute:Na+ symporter